MSGSAPTGPQCLWAGAALLLACSGPLEPGAAPAALAGLDPIVGQAPTLADAPDTDPSPDVVAVELVASPFSLGLLRGRTSELLGYSDSLPGPLIRARRGDQLRVHFENQLDEPTSVHFHGIRGPNAMDGVPEVTQPAVAPGGSFDYVFDLPDAGLFWYHPHYDTVSQVGSGLYGALLVSDPDEPDGLGDEVPLVLSDMSLDADGSVLPPASDPNTIIAGNDGPVLLVNGKIYPTLQAESGRRLRLRIVNAARSRYFRLGLSGHSFLRIGADGGLSESPVAVDEPVIVPGERLDLVLEPSGEAGSSVDLMSLPIARGIALPLSEAAPLLKLEFVAPTGPASPPLPDPSRAIELIDTSAAEEIPLELTVDQLGDKVVMGINGVPAADAEPLHALVGSTEVLVVKNMTPYAHPFHLHGYFFQPLEPDGTPRRPVEFKDTIDVPPVTEQKLAVFYDDRPGMWMFHCHILDHADAGMMGMFHVMH